MFWFPGAPDDVGVSFPFAFLSAVSGQNGWNLTYKTVGCAWYVLSNDTNVSTSTYAVTEISKAPQFITRTSQRKSGPNATHLPLPASISSLEFCSTPAARCPGIPIHGEGGPQAQMNAEVPECSSLPCVFPLAKKVVKNKCEISNTSEGGFFRVLINEYSDRPWW